ncbi:neurobeachin isoform X4 [Sparus aurata]|uniref:Ig-like domain-containing protein n=1 Tax=Sparus aurata TaxID=8175 RepID=A0A671WCD8_SPAAU|nr:lymphocyte function-associated antigen 3 isoform X4 [Sparus aurata]
MARWYFLACFIPSFSLVAGHSPRFELRGQKISLKSDIPGTPDSILWKRNGNKVVEFNGQEQETYGQYENRISLDWHTAELEIADLRIEDSGEYELEVYMNNKWSTSLHKLEVVDRVAKPTISCEMNDGGGFNKSGMLLCSAEPRQPQSLMRFEWQSNGNVQPGTKLTISLGDEYDDEVYSCRVSNPLSEETATFTAKDCYPENSSVLTAVLVTIAVFSLSLLLMGLGIFFCKNPNKACFAKGNRHDPEKPGATKGSDENTADECQCIIPTTPTNPSTQRPNQEHDGDLQDEKPQDRSDENTADECQRLIPTTPTNPSTQQPNQEHDGDLQDEKPQERSDENTADECQRLIPTTPTNPSTQRPNQEHDGDLQDEKPQDRSDENKADECQRIIPTTPTNPSTQRPNQEHDGDLQDQWPQKGSVRIKIKQFQSSFHGETPPTGFPGSKRNKERPRLDLNHFANNNKGVADEDQLREFAETEVPQSENTSEPAVVLTNTISSTAAEQSESNKETAEDDEKRPPLDITVTPPTPQPRNHVGDSDTVKDLEKNKDLNEETKEVLPHYDSSDSEKDNEPVPADVSTNTMSDLESSTAFLHQDLKKDEDGKSPPANVVAPVPKPRSQFTVGQKEDTNSDQVNGETDTSGVGETHESGALSEDKQSSPVSEQKDSETTRHDEDSNLSQSETHTSEDNQQEMDKPVPAAEEESGSEGNSEEPDLYSASSHQPQSSTPTKPDNRSNDTFQESPDAAHEKPVQAGEGKTMKESDESGEREDDTGEDKK